MKFLVFVTFVIKTLFPYSMPLEGTFLINEPITIETQMLCAFIDADPFMEPEVAYSVTEVDPYTIEVRFFAPTHVTHITMTCYDMRGNPIVHSRAVEWNIVIRK